MILHLTNGDGAAGLIQEALGIDASQIVPWRDILYEGPVPDADLDTFSETRAQFLAESGYGELSEIRVSFQARNQRLREHKHFQEVVLWFEHDTYDQLQLLQILAWFATEPPREGLSLICINAWPGIQPFLGLGQLRPHEAASLFPRRVSLSSNDLDLARRIWTTFTMGDLDGLRVWSEQFLPTFPFLGNALVRLLREQGDPLTGLTWTQTYILSGVRDGVTQFAGLFKGFPVWEGPYFLGMGDLTFERILKGLLNTDPPLLAGTLTELRLTEEGARALSRSAGSGIRPSSG